MKAWQVYDYFDNTTGIVFAPTKGKAKSIAMRYDCLCDAYIGFTDIYCHRRKEGDKFYTGKPYLDWLCDEDRLLMVKEFGFTCGEEFYQEKECPYCVAKDFCSLYEEMKKSK